MPRRRAPSLSVPKNANEAQDLIERFQTDFDAYMASVEKDREEGKFYSPAHSSALKTYRLQLAPWTAEEHFRGIGLEKAIETLFEWFGRQETILAFRQLSKRQGPQFRKSREFLVWTLVELRRAATGQSTEVACRNLARAGGVKGWCVNARGQRVEVGLSNASTIEREYRRAVARLKSDSGARDSWKHGASMSLAGWRKSGKLFDTWERENLKKPGWRYR